MSLSDGSLLVKILSYSIVKLGHDSIGVNKQNVFLSKFHFADTGDLGYFHQFWFKSVGRYRNNTIYISLYSLQIEKNKRVGFILFLNLFRYITSM